MPRPFWQFLTELGLAYPVAIIASIALDALIENAIDWLLHPSHYSFIWFILDAPILGVAWLTAALIAFLVSRRAAARPYGLLAASRAGEWVWIVGAAYIVSYFFAYVGYNDHWLRLAVHDLFLNHEEIGNIFSAPFYMGIAYSLTRRLLRQREERRATSPESRAAN